MGPARFRTPRRTVQAILAEAPDVEGGELRIALEANSSGRLARAVTELTVNAGPQARRIVATHVGAILARLAFETDALIVIHSI